jgi:hypothetical protein
MLVGYETQMMPEERVARNAEMLARDLQANIPTQEIKNPALAQQEG